MDELKRAVKNALELYAETSGMTLQEVGKRFAESAACLGAADDFKSLVSTCFTIRAFAKTDTYVI